MELNPESLSEKIPSLRACVPANFRKDAKPTWHQRRRKRAVLQLMSGVSGRVLDYGCGYGDLTYVVSKSNDVVGCDVDANRVAFATQEYAPIPFVHCDASGAPFPDGSYDAVLSVVVIHFVPDPARYLAEVARLLKPGGMFLIVCQNQPVVRNALRRIFGKGSAPTQLWVPAQTELAGLLTRTGFEIVDSIYFYDPPFGTWKNLGDWAFGAIEQFCSLLRLPGIAMYYGYRVRKIDR